MEYAAGKGNFVLDKDLQAEAEVGWTKKELKNFDDFEKRLLIDYKRLEKPGINYRNHKE